MSWCLQKREPFFTARACVTSGKQTLSTFGSDVDIHERGKHSSTVSSSRRRVHTYMQQQILCQSVPPASQLFAHHRDYHHTAPSDAKSSFPTINKPHKLTLSLALLLKRILQHGNTLLHLYIRFHLLYKLYSFL